MGFTPTLRHGVWVRYNGILCMRCPARMYALGRQVTDSSRVLKHDTSAVQRRLSSISGTSRFVTSALQTYFHTFSHSKHFGSLNQINTGQCSQFPANRGIRLSNPIQAWNGKSPLPSGPSAWVGVQACLFFANWLHFHRQIGGQPTSLLQVLALAVPRLFKPVTRAQRCTGGRHTVCFLKRNASITLDWTGMMLGFESLG